MRILVASAHATFVGGTESYLDSLVPSLIARGHEVAHCHEHPPKPGAALVGPADLRRIGAEPRDKKTVLEECLAWRPDVVFQNGVEDPHLARALLHRLPSVFLVHDYHGTCVSGLKRFAFPSMKPCHRRFGLACLACYLPRRCGGRNPITMVRLYALNVRRLDAVRRHDRVLVTSRHMREEFSRHGVPPERLALVPYMAPGAPEPAPPGRREVSGKLLLIGRLTAPKGGPTLVAAVAVAARALGRRLELIIAGDGPDRERVAAAAREHGVPVRFEGWVGKERRRALYEEVDAIAVPSLWPEPFGLVGVEAAYLGVPAIAFDSGGITEWLEPGVSGEVAPGSAPTAAGLAEAVARALRDPEHLARLRRGAWEGSQRFTIGRHIEALEAEFDAAIRARRDR